MTINNKLTRSLLLGVAALSLQAAPIHAFPMLTDKPQIGAGMISRVAMDVDALRQQLAAAEQALADAQANGGDVAAAQAQVDAAQAQLSAAEAEAQQAPAEEPQAAEPPPEPEPQPEPEPAPASPAPEPAPEPEPKPAPVEEPKPEPEAPAVEEPQAPAAQEAPATEAPAEPAPVPEAEQKPAEEAPVADAPAEQPATAEQPGEAAPETAPVPEEQTDPAPGAQPADAVDPPKDAEAPVPQESPDERPLPDEGPAPTSAEEPAATDAAPAVEGEQAPPPEQVEAEPMSKEQLDNAKAIAEDPSKTDETVILPVDKGAAVLDSEKEADLDAPKTQDSRRRARAEAEPTVAPDSDAAAQSGFAKSDGEPRKMRAANAEEGRRIDRRPRWDRHDGVREREGRDNRIILQFGNNVIVRSDDSDRFTRDGNERYYEELPRGRVRETIVREDGSQVVTIRNRYGEMIQRSRIDSRGREYVLFYAPDMMDGRRDDRQFRDPGRDLPPMRLNIPVRDYIIDTSSDPDRNYYNFLEQPPVEPVERVYSLDEVKYSARIRDKVRRIDLDTITFATGSAEIPMSQARTLRKVADAMTKILDQNPAETFLIEGHTDAVGSDDSNLILSDERAESVANLLTDVYGVPPENLATQGYGERYLKVRTLGAEQQNRRVTIRRVTALVRPVASNQ